MSSFDSFCVQCTQTAVNSYAFFKKSKQNYELLNKVIKGLSNATEIKNEYDCTALYISLNPENFTTQVYYDNKKIVKNPAAAYKRFKSISNAKNAKQNTKLEQLNHSKIIKDKSNKTKRGRSNLAVQIPTVDMLFDKHDRTTIKCKECLKEFPSIWNLRNHYIRVHAPKDFKCSECPRRYGSLAFLEAHKVESHCTIVCSECGKIFHNRHTHKMHELGHHMRLVCQKCGRVYKNQNTFKKHIDYNVCGQKTRANPSEAKFTCDYCNKKYTQKVSLRVHIQYEHGNYKSLECKWCKKKFWCQSRLNAHIVKHTQEKKFHCTICKRNFVTKESLLYHTRIHTGEKPYPCPECDSRFLSASRRAEHVKRYHVGATLQCDICHSKFNSQCYLQKHKRTHMKNEREQSTRLNEGNETQKLLSEVDNRLLRDYNIHSFYDEDEEIYLEVHDDFNVKNELS